MKRLIIFIIVIAALSGICQADDITLQSDTDDVPVSVFAETAAPLSADDISIPAPSAILIEKESGTVLYEKNADEKLEPASVTKVMTILLIAEAVDSGVLSLDDTITTSARAASMGGSQVYLEEGEQMPLWEMLKCIIVSSANDAAVAVAEHIAGTEEAFVNRMNERAEELSMVNTHFGNCTGLLDDPTHLTSARDIAIMSRELIKHDWIKDYTTIWMDTIRDGTFGLSNTNKLIYYYSGATGLKTGFTSSAGHCLSATAERDGVEYIAVVLHCSSSADRFESAKTLLSYAFSNYTLIDALPDEVLPPIAVSLGKEEYIQPVLSGSEKILIKKTDAVNITKSVELVDEIKAPVSSGTVLGKLSIYNGNELISETDIISTDEVARISLWDIFKEMLSAIFCGEFNSFH